MLYFLFCCNSPGHLPTLAHPPPHPSFQMLTALLENKVRPKNSIMHGTCLFLHNRLFVPRTIYLHSVLFLFVFMFFFRSSLRGQSHYVIFCCRIYTFLQLYTGHHLIRYSCVDNILSGKIENFFKKFLCRKVLQS